MATYCISSHLKPVNEALREFEQLYEQLHGLITIKVGDLNWVYKYVSGCVISCLCAYEVTQHLHIYTHTRTCIHQVARRTGAASPRGWQARALGDAGARLCRPLHAGVRVVPAASLRFLQRCHWRWCTASESARRAAAAGARDRRSAAPAAKLLVVICSFSAV